MQINVSGHHVEVTAALKNYVTDKLQVLEHHFHHITQIHVTLSVENNHKHHKAAAQVNLAGGQIHADATDDDMYAAIDEMIKKLDIQVVKHKEKMKHHRGEED